MAKAISSAVDVLSAIAGKTEVFETNGVVVELRSLEWAEVQSFTAQYKDNESEFLFQAAKAGLHAPALTEEQLRKASTEFVINVGRRVIQMSGMGKEDDGPLAGSGSSPS